MSWLTHLFQDVENFFASPKLVVVEKQIESLLPAAVKIVQEINTLAPTKTLAQFNIIATKYALPAITAIAANPVGVGNVALNLATDILQKNHAPAAAVSLLNTVVQLAVTQSKTQ